MAKQTDSASPGTGAPTRRRGAGEGSIYQRTDGRWVGVLDLGFEGGKRRRKSFYGEARAEVARKLRDALHAQDRGAFIQSDERTRLRAFLPDWLERMEMNVRPSTHRRYRELLTLHAIPALGATPLAKLTPQHLERLYASLVKEGLSPTTVRQLHAILHHALADALKKGLIVRNVAELASPPRMPHHEIAPYSPEEVAQLLHAAEGERLEALYVLAIATGARLGELLALRWQDVELEGLRPAMHVRGTLVRLSKCAPYVAEPKTARSRRTVPLQFWAVLALREHRRRQLEERLRAGAAWRDQGLVFCDELGQFLDGTRVLRYNFYPMLRLAGLRQIRLHDLRHTSATLALRGGTDLKRIADMLGHSTIAITANVYAHTTYDTLSDATAAIEQQITHAHKRAQ